MAEQAGTTKQHFTQAAFDALLTTDRLMAGTAADTGLVSPTEMYAYAVDASHQPSPGLLDALNTQAPVQASFRRLLNNTARYHLPQVAAASSGDIEQRESEGCKIAFRPSRANAAQIYVIIECIGDTSFNPAVLFVCAVDGTTNRMELPVAQNGRIQLLLERESDMAKGLLNIKTEVYLK